MEAKLAATGKFFPPFFPNSRFYDDAAQQRRVFQIKIFKFESLLQVATKK